MGTVIQAQVQIQDAPGALGERTRHAGAAELSAALHSGRERLLDMFAGFEAALGSAGLALAFDPILNLPLWELGHIARFEEWWTRRNPARSLGTACPAPLARIPSLLASADSCYDSANVAHATRWQLDLPNSSATRRYLSEVRDHTLKLLDTAGTDDSALYFFRLVLAHEDMHREAWFMMAQHLGLDLGVPLPGAPIKTPSATGEWQVPAGAFRMGAPATGFAFDNELAAHALAMPAFTIDRAPVTWGAFLPFIDRGGYDDESLWTRGGWEWRRRHSAGLPLHLRRRGRDWEQNRFGQWAPLDLMAPAIHLNAHEACAWCRFAGRRLPTEAEWEYAALRAAALGENHGWGSVWEWTSSPFVPYVGFVAHPYREYSQPFFDGRPVLRGGSMATEPRMLHTAYRNYFAAERQDVFSGFRSCAL